MNAQERGLIPDAETIQHHLSPSHATADDVGAHIKPLIIEKVIVDGVVRSLEVQRAILHGKHSQD